MDRYARQRLLSVIGDEGQRRLEAARVAVIGLGALGSAAAECLVRAGVGNITLIDRDLTELTNLQRQILYDEEDVREGLPKAVAAVRRLHRINSTLRLTGRNENLHAGNIDSLVEGAQVLIDGTDNIETRYLLNDYSIKHRVPWVYGGAIGTSGTGLFVLPGEGPCLRCVFPDPPRAQTLGTCDTVGILGTIPVIVGAWQASMAIRFFVEGSGELGQRFLVMDLWGHGFAEPALKRRDDCPTCGRGDFPFLARRRRTTVVGLCGSDSFQITPPGKITIDLEDLASRLQDIGEVSITPYYLRFSDGGIEMILYPAGRAQIKGAGGEKEVLSFYAKYVGL